MKHIIVIILLFFISACATPGPTSTVWDANGGESLMMDSKQRLVINVEHNGQQIICAEPSPDTVSTLDTETKADLEADLGLFGVATGIDGAGGGFDRSIDEDSTTLTNRTQAIQVLRDGLYRACEAFANGLLGKEEYRAILGAYDEILVALVAIDSLQETSRSSDHKEVQYQATKSTEQVVRDYYCMKMGGSPLQRDQEIVDRMCKE